MGTTDTNGIYFYEETDAVSPLQTLLNTGQQSVSDAITDLKTGVDGNILVHRVADLTARGTLVTAYGPTATNPLYVHRSNAGVGRELEYTLDGTTFRTLPALETAWANASYENGWITFPNVVYGTPGYMREASGLVVLRGLVAPGTLTDATTIFTLPAGFRPANDRYFTNLASGATAHIAIGTNGQVRFRAGTGTPAFMCLDMIRFHAEA